MGASGPGPRPSCQCSERRGHGRSLAPAQAWGRSWKGTVPARGPQMVFGGRSGLVLQRTLRSESGCEAGAAEKRPQAGGPERHLHPRGHPGDSCHSRTCWETE
ncbi:hypothetical protein VULLAG_LOCUS14948 [Vulpes lagopus]